MFAGYVSLTRDVILGAYGRACNSESAHSPLFRCCRMQSCFEKHSSKLISHTLSLISSQPKLDAREPLIGNLTTGDSHSAG